MDLRTRPMWSVRAMRRLMTRPAPPACLEAPLEPRPASVPAVSAPAREVAQVVAVPHAARRAAPAATPNAPVRVLAKSASAPATPSPAVTASAAVVPTSGPARLPTAPVKHGTAYDWTGLP